MSTTKQLGLDDERTGLFIECSAEELAGWETAVAVSYPHLTVEAWARIQLDCQAAFAEQRFTGADERPEWWRRLYLDEPLEAERDS